MSYEREIEKHWRNAVRLALIIGFMCGLPIGILIMYMLNLIGWY